MINRRQLVAAITAGFTHSAFAAEPWSASEIVHPADLAKQIESGSAPPIVCVAFPFLYRQRHIRGAKYAGPGNKPEGIKALETFAASLDKSKQLVLYCGCCPMADCPNIRPAYETLKRLGFKAIRVLDVPTNMHTDWVTKGYPVES